MKRATTILVVLVGLIGSCGSSTEELHFRCDRAHPPVHVCDEYDTLDSASLAGQEGNCKRPGEAAVAECPTLARLGTCQLPEGSVVARFIIYGDVTDESGEQPAQYCSDAGGSWEAR